MSAPVPETDRLDPVPEGPIRLKTGLELNLVPLKTRQLFRLLRILTHGAGAAVLTNTLDFGADPEEFAGRLAAVVMLAIPDAETETIEFVASMVEPVALVKKPEDKLSKKESDANQKLWDRVNTDLFNPDPFDLIDIVIRIVQAEADDLQALGKKIAQVLELFRKTGELDKTDDPETLVPPQVLAQAAVPVQDAAEMPDEPPSVTPSSAPSPMPSTPSAPSTDGLTTPSSTSPSGDSARSEPPSVPAGTPATASAAG